MISPPQNPSRPYCPKPFIANPVIVNPASFPYSAATISYHPANSPAFPTQTTATYLQQPAPVQAAPASYFNSPNTLLPSLQRPANIPATSAQTTTPSSSLADRLTLQHALSQGVKSGLMFSLLAALPIYGLERIQGSPSFLQQNAEFVERFFRKNNARLKFTEWLRSNPFAHIAASVTGTAFIGATAGAMLAFWMTKRTKNRLDEINQVRIEKQQGTYQPKPLNFLHKIGILEKPVTNPDLAYQKMMNEDLNQQQAFKKWSTLILAVKVVPLMLTMLLSLLTLKVLARREQTFLNQQLQTSIKASLHPVVIAKLAALPIIGGFIAQNIVPWIKNQITQSAPPPALARF